MPTFRVHYTYNEKNKASDIEAETPLAAANYVRKTYPGAIVHKTKVVK